MEKVIRTISPKLRQQNYRTLNTLSLPSLKNPKREKVDWLMNTEREKVLQKIRQGYYPNDISYLKDRPLPDPLIKASSSSLSLDIVDIYNKTYSENETELDFLNVSKKQRSKSPQQSLVEKLLSPKRKTQPPPAKNFDIGAPTGRQEAINLTAWFELMKQKYFQKFKELLSGKGNIDRSKVLKAWKSIYLTAFQEIERQTQVHCQERGKLLQDLVEGFASLFEFINSNYLIELHRQSMNHAKEISEARLETAKKLAHFQVKLDFCEKEKFELRHNNGQCIIKIRELERLIEDFRRNEKSNLRGPKVSTQKFPNASFEESPVLQENKETFISVPETLTAEINKKMAKLAELKKKIQEFRETLQVLESEVCDKRAALASLNFEIELRQSLVRPVAKFTPKSIILLSTSKNKKRSDSVILDEEVKNLDIFFNSEEFFKKLLEKPKERLTRKCKISQDHVFQSLSVIYQRAIIQIEIFNEIKDFQGLVYRQFVKLENNKKGEKILKNFISGCLKLSDFLRVSVFLRFLGLGGLISSSNFSTKTLSVYLSAYLLMDSLQVGLLVHKDTSSPSQFYPVVRAQATLKELSTVYPNSSKLSIDSFLSNNLIQDPKQINPQGLIELEKFLQKLAEEYEDLVQDISENCSKIFEIASKRQVLSLDLFLRLIQQVSKEKMLELSENVEKELQDFQEIKVSQGVEVCLKFNLFTTEDILGFLGNLASVSQNFAKNLLLSQYPSPIPSVYQNILDEIEEVPFLIILTLVQACRKYECVSLGSDICAKRAENSTLVNLNPCTSNKRCLVSQLEDLEANQSSDTLYCEEFKSYDSYQWTRLVYQCGERKNNRELVGKGLVRCQESKDCLLKDDSFTDCRCGADGAKYCVPAWDSSVFDSFWQECNQGIYRDRMDFWILFKEFYPLWVTSKHLECIRGSVYQINLMVLNEKKEQSFGRNYPVFWILVALNVIL